MNTVTENSLVETRAKRAKVLRLERQLKRAKREEAMEKSEQEMWVRQELASCTDPRERFALQMTLWSQFDRNSVQCAMRRYDLFAASKGKYVEICYCSIPIVQISGILSGNPILLEQEGEEWNVTIPFDRFIEGVVQDDWWKRASTTFGPRRLTNGSLLKCYMFVGAFRERDPRYPWIKIYGEDAREFSEKWSQERLIRDKLLAAP